eukprot:scaffold50921_cov77-Phaeocystis_antarctica.AAC.3
MHQPTLTLTLTRLGAAVLALARRPGGGAPPWRWRAVLAAAPSWRQALAPQVGGYAPSWRLRRIGASAPCRRPRAVLAARARRPGCGAPSWRDSPPWRERAVPGHACRFGASAPSRRLRAVLVDLCCAIWAAAPAWRLRAVPADVRWLGASAQSRRMRAFAR